MLDLRYQPSFVPPQANQLSKTKQHAKNEQLPELNTKRCRPRSFIVTFMTVFVKTIFGLLDSLTKQSLDQILLKPFVEDCNAFLVSHPKTTFLFSDGYHT